MAKKKKKSKNYFTQETEDAIIKYNELDSEKDKYKRNLIYEKKIYWPLSKMAEFLIHTFKFYYFDVPSTVVQKQVVAFMTTKLNKFDPSKGSKAFSYFSIVGKNWLIYHNNRNYKKMKKHRSTSSYTSASKNRFLGEIAERMEKNSSPELINDYNNIIKLMVKFIENNINVLWKKQRDKNIAWAIIKILERHNKIETIHKKALYILIREYSGEKTMYITKVLKKIQEYYGDIKDDYFNNKISNKLSTKFK